MPRPRKEGLDYFPHDVDASSDEKVEALRALYGNDGYAFYFILLERIYRSETFEINISDAETRQILAKKVAVTPERFEQILQTALKWGCFDAQMYENRGVLTSRGIKKRAQVVTDKRERMRQRYSEQQEQDSAAETTEETGAEMPQSKVKESKEKDIHTSKSPIPYDEVVAAYHQRCPDLPAVRKITDARRKSIKARIEGDGLQTVFEVFRKAGRSDFLCGRVKDWHATFDWLLAPSNFVKVLEGTYDNRASPSCSQQTAPEQQKPSTKRVWT